MINQQCLKLVESLNHRIKLNANIKPGWKRGMLSCGTGGLCFVHWCQKGDEPIRCVGGSSEMGMAQTRLSKGAAYFNPFGQTGFWKPDIVM